MSQTPEGAKKAQATKIARYGVDEDGKSIQNKEAGKKGGEKSTNTGFALMDKEKLREVSAKGGASLRCIHKFEVFIKEIDGRKFYECANTNCRKVRYK